MNEKTETKYGPITESIYAIDELCDQFYKVLSRLEDKVYPIRIPQNTESKLLDEVPKPKLSEVEERLMDIRRKLDCAIFRTDLITQEIRL